MNILGAVARSLIARFRRASVIGLLFVITGLLLGAVLLGVEDAWSLKIAGFVLVALAVVLVIVRRPGAFWTIAFLFDREARTTARTSGRLTLLGLVAVGASVVASHVWLSGNWMAQAGLSIASLGGGR